MNSIGILNIIAVYGSAFIILLLLIATFLVRIISEKKRKGREQTEVPAVEKIKPETYPMNGSIVPDRMLPSSEIGIEGSKQNTVIKSIERLSPLKRGILWAEILGRPGGRRRRNT